MAVVVVQPGVCALAARVECAADADYHVDVRIESDCPRVRRLGEALEEGLSALEEVGATVATSGIYAAAAAAGLHLACPVPVAVVKAMEVAAGLALPADVHLEIGRE